MQPAAKMRLPQNLQSDQRLAFASPARNLHHRQYPHVFSCAHVGPGTGHLSPYAVRATPKRPSKSLLPTTSRVSRLRPDVTFYVENAFHVVILVRTSVTPMVSTRLFIVPSPATGRRKAATTIANTSVGVYATRNATSKSQTLMLSCRAGITLTVCLAGSTGIRSKQNVVSWSIGQFLDAITRSNYPATSTLATHPTFALQLVLPYSRVVMLAKISAAIIAREKGRRLSGKITANACSNAGVISLTASTSAPLLVMVKNRAHFATKSATLHAVTRDAQRSAASHAPRVQKRNVRLAAHTPSATCHVPHRAIGCRTPSDARRT
jgi:hypothetical protein